MNNPAFSADRWKPVYLASGQLLLFFARIESYLAQCVRFNLGWRTDLSRYKDGSGYAAVILGSQRFKATRDTIKRVIEHENSLSSQQRAAVKEAMDHCGHIAAIRDKIAHQMLLPHPDDQKVWLLTDSYSTRDLQNARTWQIRTAAFTDCTHDLSAVINFLGPPSASGTLFINVPNEPPTWRYKPSELKLLRPEMARDLRARVVQPGS